MSARRFFVEGTHDAGDTVEIADSDAHKIVRVLRLASGEAVEIVDSAARVFAGRLTIEGNVVRATLADAGRALPEPSLVVDVAQAIPKGQKMDFVIEKLTELGAAAVLPFQSERTVARDVGAAKLDRWRRLAKTAAAQSGRDHIPIIEEPQTFADIVNRFPRYDCVLVPWEALDPQPLAAVLPHVLCGKKRALIVIGPEGGFSHAEARAAEEAGAHLISLGTRILRTETAALALIAIVLLYVVPERR